MNELYDMIFMMHTTIYLHYCDILQHYTLCPPLAFTDPAYYIYNISIIHIPNYIITDY